VFLNRLFHVPPASRDGPRVVSDPAIAALMNRGFVNIKVVPRGTAGCGPGRYMAFIQGGHGRRRMADERVVDTRRTSGFRRHLSFSPDERYGRAGFPQISSTDRTSLECRPRARSSPRPAARWPDSRRRRYPVQRAGDSLEIQMGLREDTAPFASAFHARHGGSGAPKFPRPSVLNFLMRGDDESRQMAFATLRAMSRGGMRDQLGGGFHRYSVDEFWHVPHFERCSTIRPRSWSRSSRHGRSRRIRFLRRSRGARWSMCCANMTHPSGGFYSAEDADGLIARGSHEQAKERLCSDPARGRRTPAPRRQHGTFAEYYGVTEDGNTPRERSARRVRRKNVSDRDREGAEPAIHRQPAGRSFLRTAICVPTAPISVDKILNRMDRADNSRLSPERQGRFGEQRYLQAATAAQPILHVKQLCRDGDLLRSWRDGSSRYPGFAEDYRLYPGSLISTKRISKSAIWKWRSSFRSARISSSAG